ncbi:hypothetical protein [Rhodanobacter koreensis]
METTIPVYYLDEPLSDEDRTFILGSLAAREGIGLNSKIIQNRVATVLPAHVDGTLREPTSDIELLKKHLVRAGLRKDAGRQVVWVMPKDTAWGARFQLSIFEITGFYPYVLQRWSCNEDGALVKRDTRLIDGHGMMGGKG